MRCLGAIVAQLLLVPVAGATETHSATIRFERLSLAQGLSQSTVLTIFQDSRGFIWLGTEDGLNRYDGYAFTVYKHDPGDDASLPNDTVWAIVEDETGDLIVATEGGGVAKWDHRRDSFTLLGGGEASHPDGLSVRAMHLDEQDRLWVGSRRAGLLRLELATGRSTRFQHDPTDPSSLSSDAVYAVTSDRRGYLWVGTDGGLDQLDGAGNHLRTYRHDPAVPTSLSSDQVRALLVDRSGALWVGTRKGLNKLDRETGHWLRYTHSPSEPRSLGHDQVRSLLEDKDGRLWIATAGGLNLIDPEARGFRRYRNDPAVPTSLSGNDVMSLLQDRGGVLWVGTRLGGVNKWNPATWSFNHHTVQPSAPHTLSAKEITAFTEDRAGRLWVGTYGGGINVINRITGSIEQHRHDALNGNSLSSDRVMALLHDHRGLLWVGTMNAGLNRYDPDSGEYTTYRHLPEDPGSLSADAVTTIFEDRSGALWIGTFNGGLNRLDRSAQTFTHYAHRPDDDSSLSSPRVTCLEQDGSDRLWIGTDGGGLNSLDIASGRLRRFHHDPRTADSLSAETVFSLHVDGAGTLWVGTRGGGLDRLVVSPGESSNFRFRNYSERDGLPNDVVYGIRSDAADRLWISTNSGLSRFDPREGSFTNFDLTHGLQANEFNFGAHYRSTSGELFFGGVDGFNAFYSDRLKVNRQAPPVVLTSILQLNKPLDLDAAPYVLDRLKLGHRDDVVTFEFAALDFAAPRKNRYAYKLEGFDREWIELGNINRVTYTNLDPDSYVFRVKAANNDGVWNDDGLALSLEIGAPPWRSAWAYAGYLIVAICLLLVAQRARRRRAALEAEHTRRLEEEVRVRTRQLAIRNADLEALNGQLREATMTDSLTGLRNRRFLFEQISHELARLRRRRFPTEEGASVEPASLVFLMIDLDHFKAINDTCGHSAGDRVLVQVREILEKSCRESDFVIRWGGDEFLVIARDSDVFRAEVLAERICRAVGSYVFSVSDGQVARSTCSIGLAGYPFIESDEDLYSWEDVVSIADAALFAAKQGSRNGWVGLQSTDKTPHSGLLRRLRGKPGEWIREDLVKIRSSSNWSRGPIDCDRPPTGPALVGVERPPF